MGRFKNRYTVCLNYKNSDPGGRFRGEKIWWKIFHFLSSFLQMKNNPVQDKSPIHGDDFVILPEPRTAINICSKDTMNITVSQCSLNVLHNLAKVQHITTSSTEFIRKWKCEFLCSKNYHCQLNRKLNPFHDLLFNSSTDWMAEKNMQSILHFHCFDQAFSEGTASTFDYSLKEKAPFTIRNTLGIPLIVQHSANLRQVGPAAQGKLHELSVDQSMDLEHSMFKPSSRGKLSALQRQESCLFNLTIGQNSALSLLSHPVTCRRNRQVTDLICFLAQQNIFFGSVVHANTKHTPLADDRPVPSINTEWQDWTRQC